MFTMNIALAHFATELVGTPEQSVADAEASCVALWRLVDASVRRWVPMALEDAGHAKDAAELRGLPVVTAETSRKARNALKRFLEDLSSAPAGFMAAAEHAVLAIEKACEMEKARRDKKLSSAYVVAVLSQAATQAARCANRSGEAGRAEARKLVADLTAGFKG